MIIFPENNTNIERIKRYVRPTINSLRELVGGISYTLYTKKHLLRLKKKYRCGKGINVFFIIQFPEMWNSERSLFELLNNDDRFNVKVFTLPKGDGFDYIEKNIYRDDAFNYFDELGINVEQLIKNGKHKRLSRYDTDFIFVQRPYNDMMPSKYRFNKISRKGLICYIPYSGRLTKGIHLTLDLNPILMIYMFAFFADGSDSYTYVDHWIRSRRYEGLKYVYNVGYPRYDLIHIFHENDSEYKSRFTWLPRWSLDEWNDKSSFFEYLNPMLDYFNIHKEVSLLIRPHPLMFTNFLKNGAITEEEIKMLFDRVNNMSNVSFDDEKDYLKTFNITDIIIADGTSLLFEFFYTGRPIICFQDYHDLTEEGKMIVDTFIHVNNSKELIEALESVPENDPMKEKREETLKKIRRKNQNAAENIRDALLDIARGK